MDDIYCIMMMWRAELPRRYRTYIWLG